MPSSAIAPVNSARAPIFIVVDSGAAFGHAKPALINVNTNTIITIELKRPTYFIMHQLLFKEIAFTLPLLQELLCHITPLLKLELFNFGKAPWSEKFY
jgi:hypothetical protein